MEYYWPDSMNFSVYRVPIPSRKLGDHILAKNVVHHLPQQLPGGRNNLANKNQI